MRQAPGTVRQIEVTLDGEQLLIEYELPDAMTAWQWAATQDWRSMFPNALPGPQHAYWLERLRDGADPLDDFALRYLAWTEVARAVYGVHWWVASRLLRRVEVNRFTFETWACTHGVNPEREVSALRLTAAAWAFLSAMVDPEEDPKGAKLEAEVFATPEGFHDKQREEARMAANRAQFAKLTGGMSAMTQARRERPVVDDGES